MSRFAYVHLPQIRNTCEWNTTNVFEVHYCRKLCIQRAFSLFAYSILWSHGETEGSRITALVYIMRWFSRWKNFVQWVILPVLPPRQILQRVNQINLPEPWVICVGIITWYNSMLLGRFRFAEDCMTSQPISNLCCYKGFVISSLILFFLPNLLYFK